jgi:hypothetical protein
MNKRFMIGVLSLALVVGLCGCDKERKKKRRSDRGESSESRERVPRSLGDDPGSSSVGDFLGFGKYNRRAKTSEAIDQIDKMVKGAAFYYTKPFIDANGQKQPCQFPATQGPTPVEATCCRDLGGPDRDRDDRCDSNPDSWTELTWSALTYQMNDQHYFVYSFDSSGVLSQAQFTASAFGDLDCDGVQSTFQRIGWGDPQANFAECAMYGSPAFFVDNETE